MLLANSDLLLDAPRAFFVWMSAVSAALLIGVTFHEFSHAFAANRQGDLTATRLGRLTLNPKAHLDPAGTVMLFIVGFGWGKPVPVDPRRLKSGRLGMAIVSAAGPAANVVLALAFALLFQSGLLEPSNFNRSALGAIDVLGWLTLVATLSVLLNLILAVFNLLPVPPLDGGGILAGIAPRVLLPAVAKLLAHRPHRAPRRHRRLHPHRLQPAELHLRPRAGLRRILDDVGWAMWRGLSSYLADVLPAWYGSIPSCRPYSSTIPYLPNNESIGDYHRRNDPLQNLRPYNPRWVKLSPRAKPVGGPTPTYLAAATAPYIEAIACAMTRQGRTWPSSRPQLKSGP